MEEQRKSKITTAKVDKQTALTKKDNDKACIQLKTLLSNYQYMLKFIA